MDLHAPEKPIKSLKEFLVHIGTVTIGILIALGLEQAVEAHHRAHRAAEAIEGFRKELADNQKQVDEVFKAMPKQRADIAAEIDQLQAYQSPDAPADARVIRYPGISVDLMSNASWDAAVATQAIGDLPYDEVHRYIEAFDAYRMFADVERTGLQTWQELHQFGNDRTRLTTEERGRLIAGLRRFDVYIVVLEGIGRSAGEAGKRALVAPQ